MEHHPVDNVLVSAKFVGADGKQRRLDAEHVEVRRDSCVEELVRAAFRQFCDVLPPDVNRAVVSKFVTNASSTFVRIRASRLSVEKCDKSTEYRMEFLRPGETDEFYSFSLQNAPDIPRVSRRSLVDDEGACLDKDITAVKAKKPKTELNEPTRNDLHGINEPPIVERASEAVLSEPDNMDDAARGLRKKQPKAEADEWADLDVVIDLKESDVSLLLADTEDNIIEEFLDFSVSNELQEAPAESLPPTKTRSRASASSMKSCPFCGRIIKSGRTSNLNAHMAYWCSKKEYGPPKLACSKCGKKYHAPSSSKNHKRLKRCPRGKR